MPYLSELKIVPSTIVRKTRRLPLPGMIHVGLGDTVTALQEVARTELLPGAPTIVDAAKLLKVNPEDIEQYVTVKVGERVAREQDIARRKRSALEGGDIVCHAPCDGVVEHISTAYGQVLVREAGDPVNSEITVDIMAKLGVQALFQAVSIYVKVGDEVALGRPIAYVEGENSTFVPAPVTGTITGIDLNQGTVTIKKAYKPAIVHAFIPGTVVAVDEGASVTIETPAALIQGIFGIGGEQVGPLHIAVTGPADELTASAITDEARGKIVVGGSFAGHEALDKARRVGAAGIIVGGASAADLSQLAGRNIGVGVTGSEDIGMSVVLTEGFGALRMADRTFELLAQHRGETCSLSGASQIRAGVIRPEIIIPLPELSQTVAMAAAKPDLAVGTLIRVIREPYFGQWGRITRLAGDPVMLPSGTEAPVLEVELQDGRRVEVLENNVEVFPEPAAN